MNLATQILGLLLFAGMAQAQDIYNVPATLTCMESGAFHAMLKADGWFEQEELLADDASALLEVWKLDNQWFVIAIRTDGLACTVGYGNEWAAVAAGAPA